MDERQTDRLLIRISQGDNDAFVEFYELTKRGVFTFLYSYLHNYASVEDVMQSVYLKVKLNIDKYKAGTNGRAWLLQIAKNTALNEIRKRKSVEYKDGLAASKQQESCGEITDVMRRVLTEEEQRIIVLHVLWGYKHREIAREMGVPVGTVTSKYKRSINKMQQALKEE